MFSSLLYGDAEVAWVDVDFVHYYFNLSLIVSFKVLPAYLSICTHLYKDDYLKSNTVYTIEITDLFSVPNWKTDRCARPCIRFQFFFYPLIIQNEIPDMFGIKSL